MSTPALLGGPYLPPPFRQGQTVACLFRDCTVVVTSWMDARISWPRGQPIGQRGGCGVVVTAELVRAICTESAAALKWWWGVSAHTAWSWRKAFGVGRLGSAGSQLLHQEVSERGAAANRGRRQTGGEIARRIATRRARGGWTMPKRWEETGWAAEEIALLGTMLDEQLAAMIGRSRSAVRSCRRRHGIPARRGEGDVGRGE